MLINIVLAKSYAVIDVNMGFHSMCINLRFSSTVRVCYKLGM